MTRSTRQRDIWKSAEARPSRTPKIWARTAMSTVRMSACANAWFGLKIRSLSRCQSSAATSACIAVLSLDLLLQCELGHVPLLQDLRHRPVRVHGVDRLLDLRLERGVLRIDGDPDRLGQDRLADDLERLVFRRVPDGRGRVGLVDVEVPRLQGDDAERVL